MNEYYKAQNMTGRDIAIDKAKRLDWDDEVKEIKDVRKT